MGTKATSMRTAPSSIPIAPASWCWTFPPKRLRRPIARVAGNYRKYARIPGFRAGKVPESVVRRTYAAEIRKEVIDSLLPERFNQGGAGAGREAGGPAAGDGADR